MAYVTNPAEAFKLRAFKSVEFDWVTRLNGVWGVPSDQTRDVPELHFQQRSDLGDRLIAMLSSAERQDSQLGVVYVGDPGAGKTHFLSFVRREAFALGLNFVLVDMTDVRDFWPTIALGYLESLGRYLGGKRTQLEVVLGKLVELGQPDLEPLEYVDFVAR
ncbi:MAG TPA: ATP-binding protein, partial [Blastocatellia bacterium]|nr:ATP-binding protein [Blastocatellia bacterium]